MPELTFDTVHFDGAQRAIGEIFVFENQRRDLSTSVEMTSGWV